MSRVGIVLAIVAGYLALTLAVGCWPSRKATPTAAGYIAGDRGLGLLVMYFITGATIFSAFAFLGTPGWVMTRGAAAYYILAYGAIGFAPFYVLGPRAARLGRHHGYVTQAELVAGETGSRALAGLMAAVSLVAFVPYLALQIKGAGQVLAAITSNAVPVWLGALLVYGVVTAYVLASGVLGVGWTNTLQGLFMMALAWGLGLYLPRVLYGGVGAMFDRLAAERPDLLVAPGLDASGHPWAWGEYHSAILVSAIGFSFWPHLFMKAFTARDDATIRRTVILYPTFQLFLVPIVFIGFAGVFFDPPPEHADQIVPHMLIQMDLPAVLAGLFCAGALAASMSSGDALVHAAASIAVRDGWITALGGRLSETAQRAAIRTGVLAIMGLSYAVAVLHDGSLVVLLLSAFGAVVQFAPVVTLALIAPRALPAAWLLAALTAGSLVTVALVVEPAWRPWPLHAGLYGLIVNAAVLGLGALARASRRRRVSSGPDRNAP